MQYFIRQSYRNGDFCPADAILRDADAAEAAVPCDQRMEIASSDNSERSPFSRSMWADKR